MTDHHSTVFPGCNYFRIFLLHVQNSMDSLLSPHQYFLQVSYFLFLLWTSLFQYVMPCVTSPCFSEACLIFAPTSFYYLNVGSHQWHISRNWTSNMVSVSNSPDALLGWPSKYLQCLIFCCDLCKFIPHYFWHWVI